MMKRKTNEQINMEVAEVLGYRCEWYSYEGNFVIKGKEGKLPFLRVVKKANAHEDHEHPYHLPNYMKDIKAAWEVVEFLNKTYYYSITNGITFHLVHKETEEEITVTSEEITLAICQAALKTVGKSINES